MKRVTLTPVQLQAHNLLLVEREWRDGQWSNAVFTAKLRSNIQSPLIITKRVWPEKPVSSVRLFTPWKVFYRYFNCHGTTWDEAAPLENIAVVEAKNVGEYAAYESGEVIGDDVIIENKSPISLVEWAAALPPQECSNIVDTFIRIKWGLFRIVPLLLQLKEEDVIRCCRADCILFEYLHSSQKTQAVCEYAIAKCGASLKDVPEQRRTHELIKTCLKKGGSVTADIWDSEHAEEYVALAMEYMKSKIISLPARFQTEERLWQALRSPDPADVTATLRNFPPSKFASQEMLDYLMQRPEKGTLAHEEWMTLAISRMEHVTDGVYDSLVECCPCYLTLVPPEAQTLSMVLKAYRRDPSCFPFIGRPILEGLLKMQL